MFQTPVERCVADVQSLLKTLRIPLTVDIIYDSTAVMMCYRSGAIEIPAWQGVRTIRPLREDFVRTLLHEYGHALWDQQYERLSRMGLVRTFGDHDAVYPAVVDLFLCRCFGDEVFEGYISSYAQMHPEEDFAETFAWVVMWKLHPPSVDDVTLQRKIRFMQRVLRRR